MGLQDRKYINGRKSNSGANRYSPLDQKVWSKANTSTPTWVFYLIAVAFLCLFWIIGNQYVMMR